MQTEIQGKICTILDLLESRMQQLTLSDKGPGFLGVLSEKDIKDQYGQIDDKQQDDDALSIVSRQSTASTVVKTSRSLPKLEKSTTYRVVQLRVSDFWFSVFDIPNSDRNWIKLPQYDDGKAEEDRLAGRIWHANSITNKQRTVMEDQTSIALDYRAFPQGLLIYKSPDEIIRNKKDIFQDVLNLFRTETHWMGDNSAYRCGRYTPDKTILFYHTKGSPTERTSFNIHRAIEIMRHKKYTALANAVQTYHQYFCSLMQVDPAKIYCSFIMLRYANNIGFDAHVDGVNGIGTDSGGNNIPGPVFNISVGQTEGSEKPFDILPFLSGDKTLNPLRITVKQWDDIICMDGFCRVAVQHAVPYNNNNTMYTLAFKYAGDYDSITKNRSIMKEIGIPIHGNTCLNVNEIIPMIIDSMVPEAQPDTENTAKRPRINT